MSIKITLPDEVEARLRQHAEATGAGVDAFVRQAVEEKLALIDADVPSNGSAERRIAELRAWAASHPPLPYEADDSRESIYEGRGG